MDSDILAITAIVISFASLAINLLSRFDEIATTNYSSILYFLIAIGVAVIAVLIIVFVIAQVSRRVTLGTFQLLDDGQTACGLSLVVLALFGFSAWLFRRSFEPYRDGPKSESEG